MIWGNHKAWKKSSLRSGRLSFTSGLHPTARRGANKFDRATYYEYWWANWD